MQEKWQSGRMYLTRNQAWWQHHRGFESHLLRQVNSLAKLRGYFFTGLALFALHCFALLSSLGEGVVDGFLILEYQKSSPTHHTLTQLRTAGLAIRNFPRAKS
jgi:hypothetical protein